VNWNYKALEALAVFSISTLVFLIVRWWILRRLRRMGTIAGVDSFPEVVRNNLATPSLLWVLSGSLELALSVFELEPRWQRLIENAIVAFVLFSMALMLNAMVQRGLSRLPFAMAGLSRTLTRLFVFGVGLIILLRIWGVSITPVITALGVGGLAVALALQDTLSNLFAGVHLLVEAPITVGNYVRIGADEEGTVTDIGWRTTRIRTGSNSTIIVPNKTITNGIILNYDLPDPRAGTFVPILVAHHADLALVEQICLDVARTIPGVLPDAPPLLLPDPGITPTHLQFKFAFQVERQLGSGLIKAELFKAILARFQAENIPLPERPNR